MMQQHLEVLVPILKKDEILLKLVSSLYIPAFFAYVWGQYEVTL